MSTPLERLQASAVAQSPLLVCYLPVGDPETSSASARCYAGHGVDVIEAGIPAQHPVLDGPEVTASMRRALAAGTHGGRAAALVRDQLGAAHDLTAVWMSYRSEPDDAYLGLVSSAGVGGILIPDADPGRLPGRARGHGLRSVPFVSHRPRSAEVAAAVAAESYVMVAATSGRTGERGALARHNRQLLEDLRADGVTARTLLGFGISGPDEARAALDLGADGVVVGSACLRAARAGGTSLTALLADLRSALDG